MPHEEAVRSLVVVALLAGTAAAEVRIERVCAKSANTIEIVRFGERARSECFAYGDAHGRTDRCVALEHDRTVITTDICPTWLLPGSHASATVGALATDGWSWLTANERSFVLALYDDPVDELIVMKKLVADRLLAAVVPRLAIIARDAPAALRPDVDAWILRTFGALGAKLDMAAIADYGLASLLGHAGDLALTKQVAKLAAVTGAHDYLVDDIAADRDRTYALKLFGGERRLLSEHNYQLLHALELSRLSVDLVLADPHLLDGVEPGWRMRVMAGGCTATNRAAIVGMFAQTAELPEITRRCNNRIDLQKRLEPALRALIAP